MALNRDRKGLPLDKKETDKKDHADGTGPIPLEPLGPARCWLRRPSWLVPWCFGLAYGFLAAWWPDVHAHHEPPVEAFCDDYDTGCPRKMWVQGFDVRISPLVDKHVDPADLGVALGNLRAQLSLIVDPFASRNYELAVPAQAMDRLRSYPHRVVIYIGEPQLADPMAEERWWPCHDARSPACSHTDRIGLAVERGLIKSHFANIIVLHELAHAYHRTLPSGFENVCIKDAYDAAIEAGKYLNIRRSYRSTAVPPHNGYTTGDHQQARLNHIEYFAWGTTAYYLRNPLYPFDRHDLYEHDPDLYWIVKAFWEDADSTCPITRAEPDQPIRRAVRFGPDLIEHPVHHPLIEGHNQ